jgi:hypothetical protein
MSRFVILGFVSTIALADAANAQAGPWGLTPCTITSAFPEPYGRVTIGPAVSPASCYFCGSLRKYMANGQINPYLPPQTVWDPGTGVVLCGNQERARLLGGLAMERAEVRGWLLGDVATVGGGNNGEDEVSFEILLDIGWTNRANVYAVNTLAQLSPFITPANVVAFGRHEGAAPDQPGGPATLANAGPAPIDPYATFGGQYAAVVHVEIDGWGNRILNPEGSDPQEPIVEDAGGRAVLRKPPATMELAFVHHRGLTPVAAERSAPALTAAQVVSRCRTGLKD